jgi:hypothetical protein
VVAMNKDLYLNYRVLHPVRYYYLQLKIYIFWDIMMCNLVKVSQHFRRTYCFHLQG